MKDFTNDVKIRIVLLSILIVLWSIFLVYDIRESNHILIIVVDVIVLTFFVVVCFSSLRSPSRVVKSLQEVEDEIAEIESKQKQAEK